MNTNTSLDLLSKLLASENISLVRENVSTASFDVTSRVLKIPAQMNLSSAQELLMVMHEVGHALFTGIGYIDAIRARKDLPNFGSYMNVVEDARIERMMKVRYPGARKDFARGYTEFFKDNFFKLEGQDPKSLALIDRINVYFKLGLHIDVRFNESEHRLVRLVESATTMEEVIAAATAIYEYVANNQDQTKTEQKSVSFEDAEDGDTEESDEDAEDGDTEESDEDGKGGDTEESNENGDTEESDEDTTENEPALRPEPSKPDSPIEPPVNSTNRVPEKSETQEAFDQALDDTVISNRECVNCSFDMLNPARVRHYSHILKDAKDIVISPTTLAGYQRFKAGNNKLVNLMVKEFNVRKAASEHKRSYVAKSGSLDASKLCQYKIADDIFQRYQISATSTNHGIMILLDWSGSIDRQFRELVGQVITVVEFCRRVNIKIEVYGFTTGIDFSMHSERYAVYETIRNNNGNPVLSSKNDITMIQLFSSAMSSAETELMSRVLHTKTLLHQTEYRLNATPLVAGTLFAYHYLGKFRAQYNLEKVNLVILTDGHDNSIELNNYNSKRVFMRDSVTNRSYLITNPKATGKTQDSDLIQRTIVRAIKDRYPFVTTTGFFVANTVGDLRGGLYRYTDEQKNAGYYDRCVAISRLVKKEGAVALTVPGYDRLIILSAHDSDTSFNLHAVNSDMTGSQLSSQLKRAFNNLRGGRIMAKEFIDVLA